MAQLKKIVSLFVVIAVCLSCSNKTGADNSSTGNGDLTPGKIGTLKNPEIKFEKQQHNFGIIQQGEKVTYSFKFKNIGLADLIIKDAKASCGCTVPKYSREPIASGEEGLIEVVFDSNGRMGKQLKTITVWTNCQPEQIKLEIVSEIVVPK
jgi:hypothetical protein